MFWKTACEPMPCLQAGDQEFLPRGFKREIGKLQSADEFKLPGARRSIRAIAEPRLLLLSP